ncbi:MAG TPA: pyruvate dehydrogenase complex dihydrolipoamide acetyltransferase [Magnetospirillaceae bacterium]|jgi:pyruvate dehydrogenase E2 component (dihydrolipoamide acetyltransferase)
MPIQILMPALSPTMTEGSLGKWHKKEGDKVKSGDVIAEIETDKATMEFEAVDEGTIGKILVPEGTQGVAINTPIAVLLTAGENASALANVSAAPAPAKAAAPAQAAAPAAEAPKPAPATPTPAAAPATAPASAPSGGRVFASPLAKRIAKEAGIDIARLTGSGPHGRIILVDVEKAKKGGVPAGKLGVTAPAGGPAYREIPLNNFRKVVARRLTEAKQTVPHFYLTIDTTIDKLLALRAEVNASLAAQKIDAKLSVNDFVIKAVALALRKVPSANASFTETAIREYTDVDVSVAVATPNGLITPIIRHADQKSLVQISTEMKGLAARARDNKLKPEEFQGGTFSISNLGMYGVKQFEAIINPPQGCILAVGAGEQRPIVKDGQLAIATQMSCTLSVDHRVVDGAIGAEFLQAFKPLIEDPIALLL